MPNLTTDIQFTKHVEKNARFFLGVIRLQYRKMLEDSVRELAYDIPKRNLGTL